MTKHKHQFGKITIYFLLVISMTFQSCEKNNDSTAETGEATVTVSLAGIEFDDEGELSPGIKAMSASGQTKMASNRSTVGNEEQPFAIVPFDDNLSIYATIKQESTAASKRVLSSSNNKGAIVREPLDRDVRYRLLIFGPNGAYVTFRDYVYGSESSTAALNLDGGTTYTFVAYSFNSTAALPALTTTPTTLANTSLSNLTGDFLYFKNTISVATGTNNLSIVLKHMFSEITTILTVGTTTGNVQGFTQPQITPTRSNASIALSTNVMSYPNGTVPVNVSFTAVGAGAKSTTSTPNLIISPATTTAAFNFGSLTINGITRSNISIPNVKINPGRKYTLTLSVNSPCIQSTLVSPTNPNFNLTGGTGVTFTTQGVNASLEQEFVLDFFELDNSFNVLFNGLNIVNNTSTNTATEIQFQNNVSNVPRNIEFTDGTSWGANNIPEIWTLQVAAPSNNPIIRVVIDSNGRTTMYGIKASGGQLFPLRLTNGVTFRPIAWRTTSNNTVVLGQSNVAPPTLMRGTVSARRNCN